MKEDFRKIQKALHVVSEEEWIRRGEKMVLRLFRTTAETVPAYKKFLKKHGIDPRSIRTIEDFQKVPVITKENYLKAYPFHELLPGGVTDSARMISTSSGSTGAPFFWPRTDANISEASLIHELFLAEFFHIAKKKTLLVNTFALGMWVAGTTTYESISRIAEKYHMTMVTPGIDMEQILGTISALAGSYEQVIIAGYPPFVKDIIDTGKSRGIRFEKLRVRFLFAAESFSEEWRTHMHKSVGNDDPIFGSLNIYGTADALVVAHETPLSILVRSLATQNPRLHAKLFGDDMRIPTLAQWNPAMRHFEELPNSKLIFSSGSGIPLVRYDIGDNGNILRRDDIALVLASEGVDLTKEALRHGLKSHIWNLPFISIYGRDRMTASLYGLKIYPEHVRGALESGAGSQYATGRFVMRTTHDKEKNQYLEINLELHSKVRNSNRVAKHLEQVVMKQLRTVNSEFKKLHESLGDRAVPKIVLHPHQSSSLFSRKGKQKWKE